VEITVLLYVIIGLILLGTAFVIWQIKSLHVEQKEFLYEKINQIEKSLLENAKNTTSQVKDNAELFLKIIKSNENLKSDLQKNLFEMSKDISQKSSSDIEKLTQKVEEKLKNINEKVEDRLTKGFENIDKTFKDIIVGIAKISEAQKKIESLSTEVNSLQSVLTDKKSRGIFGEVQLNSILKSIFGEKKDLYDLQYSFKSGVIADAIVKAPEPLGIIAIDSKFPMENYTKMIEDGSRVSEFKQNIKKHINDINQKYIIKGTTADMAILFLPAEAIFAEINAYHEELIEYGRKRGVWIASPTTLMALLTTITAIVRDIKTQEQAKKIQEELQKLSTNFKLYKKRWDNLSKHIEIVNKDVKEISISTDKITNEFEKIERVEFDESKALKG
jgi:DNA recombination protein RmuC